MRLTRVTTTACTKISRAEFLLISKSPSSASCTSPTTEGHYGDRLSTPSKWTRPSTGTIRGTTSIATGLVRRGIPSTGLCWTPQTLPFPQLHVQVTEKLCAPGSNVRELTCGTFSKECFENGSRPGHRDVQRQSWPFKDPTRHRQPACSYIFPLDRVSVSQSTNILFLRCEKEFAFFIWATPVTQVFLVIQCQVQFMKGWP